MTTPSMPPDARAMLAEYIAARNAERSAYEARRRQVDEEGSDFVEAFEYAEDDNEFEGIFSTDPDTERGMIYDD